MHLVKRTFVSGEEFAKQVQSDLELKFKELYETNSVEPAGDGFVKARVAMEFTVFGAIPAPGLSAKACCKCKRAGDGFICSGSCCEEIFTVVTE